MTSEAVPEGQDPGQRLIGEPGETTQASNDTSTNLLDLPPPEAESESEGPSMDPVVEHMDSVISKLVDLLNECNVSGSWGRNLKLLRRQLRRLRACYCSLADAPSWYILEVCGSTELSLITEVITKLFYDAEKIVNFSVENDEIDNHTLTALVKIRKCAMDEFPGYKDTEEAIFTDTRLPKVPVRSVFSKLRKLLKENCNIPMTTKMELNSMVKQLGYLQKGFLVVGGDVPLNQLRGPHSVWLSQTSKIFSDAKNLVDTLVVQCSDPAANPEALGTSRNSSNSPLQITHVEIKKIKECASLHAQLLSLMSKHEQEAELVGIDVPRNELLEMLAEEDGESEGPSIDPMVEHMDSVISKLVDLLNECDVPGSWGRNLKFLRRQLRRLRACYCSLADAPSWYILEVCGSTELSLITEVITKLFYDAEKIVNLSVEHDEIHYHTLAALNRIRKCAMDEFPGYKDTEEAIFTASNLPMVSVRSVFSKLHKLLKENCNIPMTTKVELKSMLKQLGYLQKGFLVVGGDVPLNQLRGPDSVWLCQTSKLFCDAEHLVDTLVVPAECSEPAAYLEVFGTSGYSSNPTFQITHVEIKKITERASLHSQLLSLRKGSHIRAVYKHKQEADLVGIDGPRDELLEMLAQEDGMRENNMKGVIIVGAEGSGKTSLARVIYHQLRQQFDCAAFLTASIVVPREFYKEMASQLDPGGSIDQIDEFLQNKRYLVVIDDVCSGSDWRDSIFPNLPNNGYGSRVIAICQTYDMCDIRWDFSNKSVYELQPLGHLDSEKLFFKQLVRREASCPNAPTNIIKEILRMCGHNPLAIVSIASILAAKVTATKSWQEVMDSVYSDWKKMARSDYIPDFEDSRYILSLIYMHLPRPLNTCLLHLAVHAKNQIICRTNMANKWVAEGFIHSSQTCNDENLASMCFDDLIRRNLIQLVEYGNYLGEEIYEVNYMMHNVLRKLAHDSRFVALVPGQGGIPMGDLHCPRLLVQYSGSERSIEPIEFCIEYSSRSVTIVGPVKVYLDSYLPQLLVLDMDGCKGLDNSAMNSICQMTGLRYLSIKHTQVTEITPEIRELGCLETLDIRQTEISNLPPEIGTLQKLKILDARQTLMSCLPREIRELQNLETLDVRQTRVEELPKEIVHLPELVHLYFGQISSLRGVKLPVGSDQLKSVKVFGTVDSREWSGSAMDDISGLTGVRKLEVALHDQPGDKEQNDKLLSSIGKCENLEFLIIHGDYNPSDELPVSSFCPLLERLKVAGRFLKVPRWLAQLTTLKQLYFRVCKLDRDDLKILGGLPGLRNLAIALVGFPRKEVAIPLRFHSRTCTDLPPLEETCPAVFTSLEIFSFDCRVPWITFEQGVMPRLKHLHLKLYAFRVGKIPSGITNIHSLEKITLQYSSEYAGSGGVTKVVAAMREEASSHRNLIDLSVNGYHEEFPPNTRVDEMVTGTEIEEDSNHGNLIKTSVNGDHEVLDTRVGETITGTETDDASNDGNLMELPVDGDCEVLLSNTRVDETIAGTEIKECY